MNTRATVLAAALVCSAVFPRSTFAQDPGSLDPTFGNGGIVTTDFFNNFEDAHAMALAPDGKIVVAGTLRFALTSNFAVARYNSDGSLDTSFGILGRVITDLANGLDEASGVIVQPDGKIVVSGLTIPINANVTGFAMVRYNLNGTLDTSFGIHGKATTIFDGFVQVRALARQPDGKLVIGGDVFLNGGERQSFVLARYDANGRADTSFGKSGVVLTDVSAAHDPPGTFGGAQLGALAVQEDGKIVAAGSAFVVLAPDRSNFVAVRYDVDGRLDPSFGNGGIANVDFGNGDELAHAIAIQPDGKIVLAGEAVLFGFIPETLLARVNPDGTLDASFGNGGFSLPFPPVDMNTRANSVAVQADGRIVTAGEAFQFTSTEVIHQFAVERFETNGTFDRTFGKGGLMRSIVSFDANGRASQDVVAALVIQDDGKIVVAGSSTFGTAIDVQDFALARYVAAAPGS